MFAGIDNKARRAAGAYIGVDGVARRAKKLYMGVDGKARLCWEADGGESDRVRAYLYNGVKLPELPEWDRAAYPYAYIMYATNSVYYLAISATTQTSTVDGRKLLFGDWKYMYTDGAWTTTTAAGYGGDIVWSNYDMYYHERHESAGTVYCEASDPVPLYSYNGVELPELPEWDRSVYPYARIRNDGDSTYYLEVFSEKPVTVTWKNPITGKTVERNGMSASGKWGSNSVMPGTIDNWGDSPSFVDNDYSMKNIDTILWANYDISYVDGTTYLEASDPVPVYL